MGTTRKPKQIYVIFSVDTEHDIISRYKTKTAGWSKGIPLLKLKTWYLLHQRQPIFLSFFIHNWQAITTDGGVDSPFLNNLASFLRLLGNNGARFLSWTEAREMYNSIYQG